MVVVLTGPVHSGKTNLLNRSVARLKKQKFGLDGYLSLAVVRGGETIGYDLFDILTEKTTPFLQKTGKKSWPRIGSYFILPGTLKKAQEKIQRCSPRHVLVVDEVGPLEVRGQGVWPALSGVLKEQSRAFLLVVRRPILEQFLGLLKGSTVEIIDIMKNQDCSDLLIKILTSSRFLSESR